MYLGQFQSKETTSMKKQSLHDTVDFRFSKLRHEFRMPPRVLDAAVAEDFQSLAARVIHEKERHAVVRGEVARGKHLAVALVVGKGERGRADHTEESGLAAAMLDIRPIRFCYRRHVETVARLDERRLLARERVTFRRILDVLGVSVEMLLR